MNNKKTGVQFFLVCVLAVLCVRNASAQVVTVVTTNYDISGNPLNAPVKITPRGNLTTIFGVKADQYDTTPGFLMSKLLSTPGATWSVTNGGGNEQLVLTLPSAGGAALTNWIGILSTNATNFSTSLALATGAQAGILSTNATNYAQLIGAALTNFAGLLSTNATNYAANTVLPNAFSFTEASGYFTSNQMGVLSTNATNFTLAQMAAAQAAAIAVAGTLSTNATNFATSLGGAGTVTSIAFAPDGAGVISGVTGSPITTTGTITPTFAKASPSQFGVAEVDGSTITSSGGILTAHSGGTAGVGPINGQATNLTVTNLVVTNATLIGVTSNATSIITDTLAPGATSTPSFTHTALSGAWTWSTNATGVSLYPVGDLAGQVYITNGSTSLSGGTAHVIYSNAFAQVHAYSGGGVVATNVSIYGFQVVTEAGISGTE